MRTLKYIALIISYGCFLSSAYSQVGIGIQTPDPSAELEVKAASKGVLIPRITNFSDIASPAEGLLIYYTGESKFYYYNGTSWQEMSPFSYRQGDNLADEDDMVMDFNNDRNLGIEAATPSSRLSVGGNVTIGSGYANNNAAPVNGLLVEGNVGIGVTNPGTNALEVSGTTHLVGGVTVTGDVNVTGTISATYGTVPVGGIIMWSGDPTLLPSGWSLCDGTNGTPDLKGRFVVGYTSTDADYNTVGKTGGAETVTLTSAQMPSHTHGSGSLSTNTTGAHTHTVEFVQGNGAGSRNRLAEVDNDGKHTKTTSSDGDHSHTISGSTGSTGSGSAHENRPPYYTLAYIMRTQ